MLYYARFGRGMAQNSDFGKALGMSVLQYGLQHIDGAPLLAHAPGGPFTRTLSESLELLDAEPVVVLNLTDTILLDAETEHAISTRTLRSGCPLIVIARAGTHTATALREHSSEPELVVVDRKAAAAVRAARVRRRHRFLVTGREPDRLHRYHVRCSV